MDKKKMSDFQSLNKAQKINTIINYLIILIFEIVLIGFIITMLFLGDPTNRMAACVSALIYYLLPFVLQWVFRVRISPVLISIYLIFITIAGFLGSCLHLYYILPAMDKILHFSWGYISCFIGLYVLARTKEIDLLKTVTIIIFFVAISMATASIWEIIEFTGDTFMNQTAQGKPVGGITPVNDTMLDIICHACGTIIFTIHYLIDKLTRKNLGITSVVNDFKKDY